jgi:hypothetical protein
MSKSRVGGLFGPHHTGAVTIVDAPVRMTYARKARLTFWIVSIAVAALSGTVASDYLHPILGLLVGTGIGLVAGLVTALVVMAWPVLRAIWHWVDAIIAVTAVFYGWTALMKATDLKVSLVVVVLLLGVPAVVAPIRRRVVAFAWCAIVRHRLRMSFGRMVRTGSRHQPGCLPLILIARPTPAGERVWVWLRPGLALPDLEVELPQLAVNCFADQVRVVRADRRFAALIRVDISRRDPLRARVGSPLPDQIPYFDASAVPVSPGMPPIGLDLPDVPETADPPRSTGGRSPRRRDASTPQDGPDDISLN